MYIIARDLKILRGAARQAVEQADKRLQSLGQFVFDSCCFGGEPMAFTWLSERQLLFDPYCFE